MGKLIMLIFFYIIIFPNSAYEFSTIRAAHSVAAKDIDLDNDIDIIVGHNHNVQTDFGGVSIFRNNNLYFSEYDSLFFYYGLTEMYVDNFNNNNYPDIIGKCSQEGTFNVGIIRDYAVESFSNIGYFDMNTADGITDLAIGDLNGDNDLDIVFCCNNEGFWSYLTNQGNNSGFFSEPVVTSVDYHPGGIACGDLNMDGRDDVVVCGLKLEYYSVWESEYRLIGEPPYDENVKISDMNNDGINDIVTATWYTPGHSKDISIYFNDGYVNFDSVFTITVNEAISFLHIGDLNNDLYPDVIGNVSMGYPNSAYEKSHTYILFNNGDNTLQEPVDYQTYLGSNNIITSHQSITADIDNNGWLDIITVNSSYNESSVHILYNDGTGCFMEDPPVSIGDQNYTDLDLINLQNYPNPFNPKTNIQFSIPEEMDVKLTVYNLKGQVVKTLVNEKLEKGYHTIEWDGRNLSNKNVTSGIYFYCLDTEKNTSVKKMLLLN